MGIVRYYYNRYMSREAFLYKLIIALSTIAVCLPFYFRFDRKYVTGCCAKDAIMILSLRYTFTLLMLIVVFFCIRLALKDNNQNIVLRYKSKQKIWTYQILAGLWYSLESVIIIYATAVLLGLALYGVYDNWQETGSMFYMMVTKHHYPLDLGLSDFTLFLLAIIIKTMAISIVYSISLMVEAMLNESKIMLVTMAALCWLDYLGYKGVMGIVNILFFEYYSVDICIRKIICAIAINVVLFLLGLTISKYREYYKKKRS